MSHVTENGAAERASDLNGNRCPVKVRDEIIEINGVSLSVRQLILFFAFYFKLFKN